MEESEENLIQILLICKSDLINFYQNVGFYLIGESEVVHGKDKWFEMKYDL
jgi:hypothetical protein